MVQMPSRGVRVSVVLALAVVLVVALAMVATVLLVGLGPDRDVSSSTESSSAPAAVTPDEFCDLFLTLVDASSTFTAAPDEESGEALVAAARTLFEMPTPIGMDEGARVSLDQLVEGSLAQLASVPEVEVVAAPDASRTAEPDSTAFDLYLQTTCPP